MAAANNGLFGEMLIETGVITKEQLVEALSMQGPDENDQLGSILVSLGYITEKQLMKALEYRFRTPFYDLGEMTISSDMSTYLSLDTAKKYNVVVVEKKDNQLTIATTDPLNFRAFDDVRIETGMNIVPVLATSSDIRNTIVKLYEKSQTTEALESLNKEYTLDDVQALAEEINDDVDNAPVVKLINLIINHAISARASDVHIEPLENIVRIRYRIDGEMYERLSITKFAHAALITRLKIMGDMDIAEKRVPQDGRVRTIYNNKPLDLRLSVLPTVNGEKVVIRVLGGQGVVLERTQLGFSEDNSQKLDEMLKNPNGIILVSGPTGSGKSTTLYTILNEVNNKSVNVITVEDPVEYRLEGINQVQINSKAGLSFASGLRSILRQDPDIIMVGEIRDGETAEIAVRASITGHLVLSTIHTNDSSSTVSRLIDMGIEPFLVSASLVGVISQRLVRRVCQSCKTSHTVTSAETKLLGLEEPIEVYEGVGCSLCNNTGYKGRIAIHEILLITKEIRELVDLGATTDQIRKCAVENGLVTLRQSCAKLVIEGVTTMKELVRVTYTTD